MALPEYKAFKYKVRFTLEKVRIGMTFPCKMSLIYKKGKQMMEIPNPAEFDVEAGEAFFGHQEIEFESIYVKDTRTGLYKDEFNYGKVYIITHKGNKNAGVFKFSPSKYLSEGRVSFSGESLSLVKCPDADALVYFGMSFSRLEELSDQQFREEMARNPNVSVLTEADLSYLTSLNMTMSSRMAGISSRGLSKYSNTIKMEKAPTDHQPRPRISAGSYHNKPPLMNRQENPQKSYPVTAHNFYKPKIKIEDIDPQGHDYPHNQRQTLHESQNSQQKSISSSVGIPKKVNNPLKRVINFKKKVNTEGSTGPQKYPQPNMPPKPKINEEVQFTRNLLLAKDNNLILEDETSRRMARTRERFHEPLSQHSGRSGRSQERRNMSNVKINFERNIAGERRTHEVGVSGGHEQAEGDTRRRFRSQQPNKLGLKSRGENVLIRHRDANSQERGQPSTKNYSKTEDFGNFTAEKKVTSYTMNFGDYYNNGENRVQKTFTERAPGYNTQQYVLQHHQQFQKPQIPQNSQRQVFHRISENSGTSLNLRYQTSQTYENTSAFGSNHTPNPIEIQTEGKNHHNGQNYTQAHQGLPGSSYGFPNTYATNNSAQLSLQKRTNSLVQNRIRKASNITPVSQIASNRGDSAEKSKNSSRPQFGQVYNNPYHQYNHSNPPSLFPSQTSKQTHSGAKKLQMATTDDLLQTNNSRRPIFAEMTETVAPVLKYGVGAYKSNQTGGAPTKGLDGFSGAKFVGRTSAGRVDSLVESQPLEKLNLSTDRSKGNKKTDSVIEEPILGQINVDQTSPRHYESPEPFEKEKRDTIKKSSERSRKDRFTFMDRDSSVIWDVSKSNLAHNINHLNPSLQSSGKKPSEGLDNSSHFQELEDTMRVTEGGSLERPTNSNANVIPPMPQFIQIDVDNLNLDSIRPTNEEMSLSMRSSIVHLKAEINRLKEENNDLKKHSLTPKKGHFGGFSENGGLKGSLASSGDLKVVNELRQQVVILEEKVRQLETKNTSLYDKKVELEEKLRSRHKETLENLNQLNEPKNEVNESRRVKQLQKQIELKNLEIKELRADVKESMKSLKDGSSIVERLQTENNSLIHRNKELEDLLDKQKNELEKREESSRKTKNLQQSLENLSNKNREYELKIKTLQRNLSQVKYQNQDILSGKENQLAKSQAKMELVQRKVEYMAKKCVDLEEENRAFRKKFKNLKEKEKLIKKQSTRITELEDKLDLTKLELSRNKRTDEEDQSMKIEMEMIRDQLKSQVKASEGYEKEIEDYKDRLETKKSELDRLTLKNLDEIKKRDKIYDDQINNLRVNYQSTIKRLKDQIKEYKKKYEEELSRSEGTSLMSESRKLNVEADLISENQNLLQEVEELKERIMAMESKHRIQIQKMDRYKQRAESGIKSLQQKTQELQEMELLYCKVEDELRRVKVTLREDQSEGDPRAKFKTIQTEFVQIKRNVGDALNYFQEIGMSLSEITELTNILLKKPGS